MKVMNLQLVKSKVVERWKSALSRMNVNDIRMT